MRSWSWGLAMILAACADGSSPLSSHGTRTEAGDAGTSSPPPAPVADASAEAAETVETGAAIFDGAMAAEEGSAIESGATLCAALSLCDGFESDAPGVVPVGWTAVMGCNPNTQDTAVDGGGLLVGVDDSAHHGGSRSLRVVGGDSCGFYAVAQSALSNLGPHVYARLWVLFSGSPTPNHNGFLSMATAAGDHLRLGFQDSVLAWNAQTSDATLPDMDPQGTTLSAATQAGVWSCLEFHLDATTGHIEFWKDGQGITGLGYDGTSVQGVDDQWARGGPSPLRPTSLGLGWLGLNDQQTVWFDDVALGSARIGCD